MFAGVASGSIATVARCPFAGTYWLPGSGLCPDCPEGHHQLYNEASATAYTREVANNLASLLPQICQKTPCFRTEHDWPKSLDAESTTIQVDWKRLSVGRIRRHPGRFNHSMESHPAAAEIGDACAMPFFLDGADSTTGCLLNASIVFGFARLGGYSGEILRRHIIHGLRDAGVMPMPPKTQY